jgi:hypothetical protein
MTTFAGGLIAPSLLASPGEHDPVPQEGYPDPSIVILG